jgi:hypothetical protein
VRFFIPVVGPPTTEILQQNAVLNACTDFVDGDIYTDSGGSGGLYLNNESSTLQFCAAPGETVTLDFTAFSVENSFDDLTIAGSVVSDGTYTGSSSPGSSSPGTVVSTVGGCVSFTFESDASITFPGWQATISLSATCNTPPPQ